jgi:hypothetical protein
MDSSQTGLALNRNDGATRTLQDAVDNDSSDLTGTEFDELTGADSSHGPYMTWVTNGDGTVTWGIIWV